MISVWRLHALLNVTVTVFAMSYCMTPFCNALPCVITSVCQYKRLSKLGAKIRDYYYYYWYYYYRYHYCC